MAHAIDKSLKKNDRIALVVKGFCMGIADVIPGISGGTIAFLLGIYENLIASIKSLDLSFVQLIFKFRIKEALDGVAWIFLSCVFGGIILAVFTMSHPLSWALEHHPVMIHSFFFGLIVATVPIIAKILKKWTTVEVVLLLIAAVAAYGISQLVPQQTPESAWFIFLCGVIAICAMILPGISGSFLLLILGKYEYIIASVKNYDFVTLGVFLLGIVVGITTFARVLSWLFKKYHDITLATLTGLVVGSLSKIWPWREATSMAIDRHGDIIPLKEIAVLPPQINGEVFLAIVLMGVGFSLAMFLSRSGGKLISE